MGGAGCADRFRFGGADRERSRARGGRGMAPEDGAGRAVRGMEQGGSAARRTAFPAVIRIPGHRIGAGVRRLRTSGPRRSVRMTPIGGVVPKASRRSAVYGGRWVGGAGGVRAPVSGDRCPPGGVGRLMRRRQRWPAPLNPLECRLRNHHQGRVAAVGFPPAGSGFGVPMARFGA